MQESKKISTPKKCRNFVLKGVSYIALWKFTKSQDGVKNFQQQNFEQVTKLWQVTNLTCKCNCATCKLWQVTNLTPKKCRNFVLKGVSYIALWKFSKSQDGENFQSVKNFQQQNFEHWRLWKLCNGFCKLWQVTNLILFQQPKKFQHLCSKVLAI